MIPSDNVARVVDPVPEPRFAGMQTRVRTEGEQPHIVRRFAQQPFFPTLRIVAP